MEKSLQSTGPIAPVVSVCTICYNQAAYVEETIRSIVEQQFDQPFELVIGDDCSTDGTREVCEKWAREYPSIIRLLPPCENLGVIRNFFRVLGEAQGKYVAICEGDDYWRDQTKLQKQVDYLEAHPACGMVYGEVYHLKQKSGKITTRWGGSEETSFERLMDSNCIPTPTVLFRRELLERYRSEIEPEKQPWRMGDYPLWLYIARHSHIHFHKEPLAVYRILEESASHFRNYERCDSFCRNSCTLRLHFAARYAPHLAATVEEQSLWERLYHAIRYRQYDAAVALRDELQNGGHRPATRRQRKLLHKLRWLKILHILRLI